MVHACSHPVRSPSAQRLELVLGQNERNLREVLKMRGREADEVGTLYEHHMEFLRLERRWWNEQEAEALAWLDAGCPDDGVRGVMRESPDGEAVLYALFEPGAGSFADWVYNNWDSLPDWFRSWHRAVHPSVSPEE